MYYEFYIDQFFLEQLLTDCLLIAASAAIQGKRVSRMRMALGGAAAAAVTTALVCLRMQGFGILGMLAAGAVLFAREGAAAFLEGVFFLLLVTVCFGGVLEGLWQLLGFPVMASAIVAALLVGWVGRRLARRRSLRGSLVQVRLQWEERTETLCGMIDTGNQLKEPLTGRPVSIVEASTAKRLLGEGWEGRRGFYLIPFHSIGTDRGWMRGVTIDCMTVERSGRETVVARPVLAIYEGQISAGKRYQIILHPLHVQAEN